MPQINRLRIVNFSYNHDSRHIIDETFNFHGGQNALLSLANGGGKSVLVQLFLQAIVPNARIQGRNIASFFSGKKLPSYVMIEWKLDGQGGGYLLTGIGMTAADGGDQDGSRLRIRYFNFTSKYNAANAYDIANIPLMERKGAVLDIKPFREARKIMLEKARKDPYLVGYYPDDEGEAYARSLAEFGIVRDEWRNVITRINNSENGLEELFQKYRSSSRLLDDWIIKTVEEVMYKSRSEKGQLEEMLQSLVQEVVENERFIMEKQLFTGFLGRYQEVRTDLLSLLKNLEEQKQLESSLAALHGYFSEEIHIQRERQQDNEAEIASAKAEEKNVDLEERSHRYHLRKDEHWEAAERLNAAEESRVEVETRLNQTKRQEKIMQAAGLAAESRRLIAELSGIEERLALARGVYDQDERAQGLEYTLKLQYEEFLDSLTAELNRLRGEQTENEEKLLSARHEMQSLEAEKSILDSEKGTLEERLKTRTDQEKQLQRRLGQQWVRNILGELDPGETDRVQQALQETLDKIINEQKRIKQEKQSLTLRQVDMERDWKDTQAAKIEASRALIDFERNLNQYLQEEKTVKEILYQYGFDPALAFDPERLSSHFTTLVRELEQKRERSARTRNEIEEAMASIKSGHLHSSLELASALAELDIQFETGEIYLRNQVPDIREGLLNQNPLLPYTLIMAQADLNRLEESGLSMMSRRITPLLAYEDLNLIFPHQGGIAWPTRQIAFHCLYEGRVFDPENLSRLVTEMEEERDKAAESYHHYTTETEKAVLGHSTCLRFKYSVDYRYELEKGTAECSKRVVEREQHLEALETEQKVAVKRQDELSQQEVALTWQLTLAETALRDFQDFLVGEFDYQKWRERLSQNLKEAAEWANRKKLLQQSLEKLQNNIVSGKTQIKARETREQGAQQRYLLYRDAQPAEIMEGNIEELEQRLAAIKEEYSREIGELERRQQELTAQYRKTQRELGKLGLSEEDYSATVFEESELESIHTEISRQELLLKERIAEEKNVSRAEAAAATALENAMEEIKRLNAETPLPREEIKGDFDNRRKRLRQRILELEGLNKDISQRLSLYLGTRESIERMVDVTTTEAATDFVPEPDIAGQAVRWKKTLRDVQDTIRQDVAGTKNRYLDCKSDYREKNLNLDNIFKGLDPLWDKAQPTFDDYYYLYERMSQHGEKLSELIGVYETQLANLERNKQDMIQQSFEQGRRMYDEIQLVSENSRVRLAGRSRPVQMLRIDLTLDNNESARQRVAHYIEECITKVREKIRQEVRDDELRRNMARLMSSRELLNVYLGNAHIPVKVFKIDMKMQNSRLKDWEDAVRENSGGEKFVVFFSLLSALMSYTRNKSLEALGADPDSATRVLIMDNPFGPISSEHLLEPMFEIARRHRTQLICLSDLKQNSIMKCFNLIFMLKVRAAAIGGNEYLKFDEFVRDESSLETDETLEKAIYRASDFQQMPLFD